MAYTGICRWTGYSFWPLCHKQGVYFVICLKQGPKLEGVVLHRVGILGLFWPIQGQSFKTSAAPLYPNMGQASPRGSFVSHYYQLRQL